MDPQYTSPVNMKPWNSGELLWNAIGCTLCAIGCILLTWDWWQMRAGRHQHHATLAPRNIGEARWMRRVAIVAVSLSCVYLPQHRIRIEFQLLIILAVKNLKKQVVIPHTGCSSTDE
ncbi:hypothetical protein OESDEN_22816 [Oesophagostomum dentatum]|uniref:Uncharacterized protein n=1 Tax=Oesophagostomum dentatum TaxID=61180 RepID=A0A0B1RY13_OESDE|nr:hypothetical protein OESDEN_22816 [Oesophagostomum dentatum]